MDQCANRKSGSLITKSPDEAELHMTRLAIGGFSSVRYVCMYLYILLLLSSSLCHLKLPSRNLGLTAYQSDCDWTGDKYYTITLYIRIIRLPRGMRLEMRQSTSVPASTGWHLFSKSPTIIKPMLSTEMWPSVIDTPAQHLRTSFVPFATAIRHSGGEHYSYLANQEHSIFSSDVTSLPCRAVEVARELLHCQFICYRAQQKGIMKEECRTRPTLRRAYPVQTNIRKCLCITVERKHSNCPFIFLNNFISKKNWHLMRGERPNQRVNYRRDRDARMDRRIQTACKLAAGSKMYAWLRISLPMQLGFLMRLLQHD